MKRNKFSGRFFKTFDNYLSSTHHKFGNWYIIPASLSMEDWEKWQEYVKKHHPIQHWLRESVSSINYEAKHLKSNIQTWFSKWLSPAHPIIRKALPRTWTDICDLTINLNLAIIDQFKNEADASYVDWNHDEKIKEFKVWLDAAANYVRVERPQLLKDAEESYPPYPLPPEMLNFTYEELYGKQISIRKKIDETDLKYIKEMLDNRGFMWT